MNFSWQDVKTEFHENLSSFLCRIDNISRDLEDRDFHSHRYEKLMSHMAFLLIN
jgi:hypothetical protein